MSNRAALLFSSTSIVAAIVVAGMLESGWSGGRLDNRIEWLFWAGAILGATGIAAFGTAAITTSEHRSTRVERAGMVLFLVAPVLCVIAIFTNYWI